MILKYKQVKEYKPFCGDCGERLHGDNSYANPYNCKCGVWESKVDENYNTSIIEFVLKKKVKPFDGKKFIKDAKSVYNIFEKEGRYK